MNTCGGCNKKWTGMLACHCSNCHESFSGITTFDLHREATGERGRCKKPSRLGLVSNDRQLWAFEKETLKEEEVGNNGVCDIP